MRAANACPSCHFNILLSELGTATKTASVTGTFTSTSTWGGAAIPNANDVVVIPAGITVTASGTTPIAKSIVVHGILRFPIGANSKLSVENLLIAPDGELIVGGFGTGNNSPLNAGVKATISILAPTSTVTDSLRMGRGIIAAPGAVIRMNSLSARSPFISLDNSVGPGTAMPFASSAVPANWQVGDSVVVPAAYFTREWSESMPTFGDARFPNEVRTLSAKTANSVTLNTALTFPHNRTKLISNVKINVANLTRDIVIESANTTSNSTRGHVMLMTNDVQLNGVAFNSLGRTVKERIASDPMLPASSVPAQAAATNYNNGDGDLSGVIDAADGPLANSRGRYALHFHEAGTGSASPATVTNCVVRDTPGWGFVNHDSSVNFTGNVCFDFDGAGFVCEDGGETGTYDGNIAIGGFGNGEFSHQREIFGNRARGDQGDMGFTGEGFWLNSPTISVINNVVAGCKGSAFFFWCGGKFEPTAGLNPSTGVVNPSTGLPDGPGQMTGQPLTQVPAGVNPRYWDYNGDGIPDAAVITDLPIKQFTGNTAYACFTGLRFRFVNHPSVAIYTEIRREEFTSANGLADTLMRSTADSGTSGLPTKATRARFTVSNSTFWNNMIGIHGTYLTNADLDGVTILAQTALAADPGTPKYSTDKGVGGIGIAFFFNNGGCKMTNCTIENYTTGLWYDIGTTPNVPFAGGVPVGVSFTGCSEPFTANTAHGSSWLNLSSITNNLPDPQP